jgi:phosphatidate cytidylyltransferase
MSDWADPHADKLLVRVVSGLVLGGLGIGAALAGGPWLAAAAAAAVTAMAFEWVRMSEPAPHLPGWIIAALAALGSVMAASWQRFDLAALLLAAGAGLTMLRRAGGFMARLEAGFGALYIGLAPTVLVALRGLDTIGLVAVLALFSVIWSADIAAFLGGKFIGGPRLAPSLSPRKTWSGLVCGVLAAAVAGWAFASVHGYPPGLWFAVGGALGALGLGGDLFESLIKRRFGVKDASGLIPGHGGVMDRLDSLIAATLALAIGVVVAPGAAAALFAPAG